MTNELKILEIMKLLCWIRVLRPIKIILFILSLANQEDGAKADL